MKRKNLFILCLPILLIGLSPDHSFALGTKPPVAKNYYTVLDPLREHSKTSREIIKELKHLHYRQQQIDDEFSEKVFNAYLSALDPDKIFFLEKDIREFDRYRFELDTALKTGDTAPAFLIFNRYQKYTADRILYILDRLENGPALDFDIRENLALDREKAPWPKNLREREDLWRKYLKNTVLNLKLSGKKDEEITELLLKRYRNRLHRLRQIKSEDAFEVYVNAVAEIYGPHTQYFSPRATENFNINMSLSLEGIGAVLHMENEYTTVRSLVAGGPAEKSGQLHAGDRITGVGQGEDGDIVDVVGWRIDDVVQLIRGPRETTVRLEIIPADDLDEHKTRIIRIVRNKVNLEEMSAKKHIRRIEKNEQVYKIGIIEIPAFYMDFKAYHAGDPNFKSTTRDVKKLLAELKTEGVDGLIVDLRNNGGGSLQEANDLTGLFIRQGPTVQIKSTTGKIEVLGDMDAEIAYRGPLMVLVNRMSASASEIFAGAMQDYRRGVVLGDPTFGKGTVQSLITLNHGQLKVTTAKFYRVSGESTQHKGIIPDISFPGYYSLTEDGENALPNPLPWDKINYVPHNGCLSLNRAITRLREKHAQRIKSDPDFNYLIQKIDYYKKENRKNLLSLHLASRKKELEKNNRWRLDLENTRRKAKGLPLLEKLEDRDADKEKTETKEHTADAGGKEDTLLAETANIMLDFLSMKNRESYSQFVPLSGR